MKVENLEFIADSDSKEVNRVERDGKKYLACNIYYNCNWDMSKESRDWINLLGNLLLDALYRSGLYYKDGEEKVYITSENAENFIIGVGISRKEEPYLIGIMFNREVYFSSAAKHVEVILTDYGKNKDMDVDVFNANGVVE